MLFIDEGRDFNALFFADVSDAAVSSEAGSGVDDVMGVPDSDDVSD